MLKEKQNLLFLFLSAYLLSVFEIVAKTKCCLEIVVVMQKNESLDLG